MFYIQDLRYALRLLSRQPLFTLLTVLVLAGGLGLSIFTFSFLHTAMLKPLPVSGGEDIVRLMPRDGAQGAWLEARDLAELRPAVRTLVDIGAYTGRELVAGTGEGSRSIQATASEWNIFEVTRTRPLAGRTFTPDDQLPGAEPVVVLSHWAWRVLFGTDSTLIGRHLELSGVRTRVIGIMPEGFGFPVASEAWVPLDPDMLRPTVAPGRPVSAYGRLAPDATRASASAELTGLLRRVRAARPDDGKERFAPTSFVVSSYPMAQIGDEAPLVLAVLNTLATLILLLACINVTNLLLARANERARESALRLALGAPRARLIMQSMWESILLCLLGGVIATGLAIWGLGAINAWCQRHLEGNLAFWWVWGFDRTVLYAAGGFVTLATMVLGGVVARRAASEDVIGVLKDGGNAGAGRRAGKIARALVIVQVATVSVLMFFGSMAAIVAYRVATVDLGYDTRGVLASGVALPPDRYPDAGARGRLLQSLYDRLIVRGEIDRVVIRAPLAGIDDQAGEFTLPAAPAEPVRQRSYVFAALGPLSAIGSQLREGRFFDSRDDEGAAPVAIVSSAFARRHWPQGSPVGAQLLLSGLGETVPRTVVGVAGDVLLGNPLSRSRSALAVYLPLRQSGAQDAAVMFHHRGSEAEGRGAFLRTVGEIDPLLVPDNVTSFDEVLRKSTMLARSVTILFGACFGFALLLAVSGTYGLMARAIGRQTRELGVRRALGATDRTLLVMLLGQGARQLGVGALAALPFTLLVGWGFSRYFPIALGVSVGTALLVSAVITLIVLAATWLPSRRAMAIEVRDALWRE